MTILLLVTRTTPTHDSVILASIQAACAAPVRLRCAVIRDHRACSAPVPQLMTIFLWFKVAVSVTTVLAIRGWAGLCLVSPAIHLCRKFSEFRLCQSLINMWMGAKMVWHIFCFRTHTYARDVLPTSLLPQVCSFSHLQHGQCILPQVFSCSHLRRGPL